MNWSKRRLTSLLQLELGRGCLYEWPFSEENDLGAGPGLLSCRHKPPTPAGRTVPAGCTGAQRSSSARMGGLSRIQGARVGGLGKGRGRIQENLPENPARPSPLTHPPAEAPPLPTDKGGACTEATCLWGAWPRGAKARPTASQSFQFFCLSIET